MEYEGKSSSEPVTVIFVRNVKPNRINDFEEWVKGINQAVKGIEGYMGLDVIRPGDHSHPEYVIVLRFDGYEHLRAWMESREREVWVKKSEGMTIGETHIQEAHGFEPWFTLPDHSTAVAPPARYKMATVTILALYPPLLVVSTILSSLLQGWPKALVSLMNLLLLVPAMTYYIMPRMTQLFRFWLYPEAPPS